jgi:hypothetical protein
MVAEGCGENRTADSSTASRDHAARGRKGARDSARNDNFTLDFWLYHALLLARRAKKGRAASLGGAGKFISFANGGHATRAMGESSR